MIKEPTADFRPATFSPCRRYRYTLWRELGDGPVLMAIGLNPSTADETRDDPTIRRLMGYARRWGFGGLLMTNLFAYRATDPKIMLAHPDPVGERNDEALWESAWVAHTILASWGAHGSHMGRSERVREMLLPRRLQCLSVTRSGEPGHPLYLAKSLCMRPLEVRAVA